MDQASSATLGVVTEKVMIKTQDGTCPAFTFTPASAGKFPAIVFYMDAGGIRPAVVGMAERLSALGFFVLLPDLFYRFGPYGPLVPIDVFKGDAMAILGPLMASTDNARAADDTAAFISYLDEREDIKGKIGAVGFCMGGGMALTAAATYCDRFAAVASFHGSNLATDDPNSPHLIAPSLKAEVYIAAAENDVFYPLSMAGKFEATLSAANVVYRTETYAGAAHGWMKPDFPVFNQAASERGWAQMKAFFDRTLK